MLAIVKAVKHDAFGVNLDTGNFHTADPYADLERIAPYAVVCQIKTEVHPAGKGVQDADLPRLLDILRKANYRGLRGAGVRGQGGRQGRGPAAPGDAQTTDGLTVVPVQSIATADFTSSSADAIHFGRLLFTDCYSIHGFLFRGCV